MMMNANEKQEKKHLKGIVEKLTVARRVLSDQVSRYNDSIREDSDYIWSSKSEMDGAEKAANRMQIQELASTRDQSEEEMQRIDRLIDSPYFARIDFIMDQETQNHPYYIGMHSFAEEAGKDLLIYDWRAPVSSLFYDFEQGAAHYLAPAGLISGDITLKRQYKIRESRMEYMVDSAIRIDDDVLQKELSSTSSEKMKNIVVTIQKEQNAIIRNASAQTLIVQGVAGSGKTSIALHRVAYLLYRFRGALTSDNIMIISPNRVFSAYISNVLPELGEENIIEEGMEDMAQMLLGDNTQLQSFGEQIAELVNNSNARLIERISYKATQKFVDELDDYLEQAPIIHFHPETVTFERVSFSADQITQAYEKLTQMKIKDRLVKTADMLISKYEREENIEIKTAVKNKIRRAVSGMFACKDSLSLYKAFYTYINKPQMSVLQKVRSIPYDDIFPLLYTQLFFERSDAYRNIQHLLVDEMQDYTPVQYAVIKRLFPCDKTILGDSGQSINPFTSSSVERIKTLFPEAQAVELNKSYRSTYEITMLAQHISKNDKLILVKRHGQIPCAMSCRDDSEMIKILEDKILAHRASSFRTMGIICKTNEDAANVYKAIKNISESIYKIDFSSKEYHQGIIVTSAHMAKGLEFDQVIVIGTSEGQYQSDMDRSLLYIACTRAMHQLDLLYTGNMTSFLNQVSGSFLSR